MRTRKVCVIGAGAAGIAAAKHAILDGHRVTVYEKYSEVGGTWVYSEKTNIHSAMYEVMKTNLPKELMAYHGQPFPEHLSSFMDHQEVLLYLKEQAQTLPIQLNTSVEKVEHVDGKWQVSITHDELASTEAFDVVFVCNGHYSTPKIPFDTKRFTGRSLHSHDYRKAGDFADQKVLVVGAGPSGIDIAIQVAAQAKQVILLGKKAVFGGLPCNITQVPARLTDVYERKAVLSDGTSLENIDSMIICTGYQMKFPFLSSGIVQVKGNGQLVSPIWQHVVHAKYPRSLFFIGMNNVALTFPLFEQQTKLALAIVSGRTSVPEEEQLISWEKQRLSELQTRGMTVQQYHFLGDDQWAYMKLLAQLGNFEPLEDIDRMEKMYTYLSAERKIAITTYKEYNFILEANGGFTVISRRS